MRSISRPTEKNEIGLHYDALLKKEVHETTKKIPPIFSGGAPLCLSLFQPTPASGRMVFLDRTAEAKGEIIWHKPGMSSHSSFLDPDPAVPSRGFDGPVTEAMVSYYRNANPIEVRRSLGNCYNLRFPPRRRDQSI